jgi:hypothetical protein
MNRAAFGSQAIVTANNLILSLSAIMLLEGENFKVWFIVSQTFFITQTFLRSAFFEPANFHKQHIRINFKKSLLTLLMICTFNFIVIGFSFEFSFTNSLIMSLAVCFSLFQDNLRYRFISYYPQKVAFADGLVLLSTLIFILITKISTVIFFTSLYIAIPNLISILYLIRLPHNEVNELEVFSFKSMPIYSLSGITELGLNQALTVMSALFLSNSELRNLRAMMLIAAPLTSLRLFSWSGLIVRTSLNKSSNGKKKIELSGKFSFYLLLAVLLFILSYSNFLSSLPIYSKLSLALVLLTNLISLVFVEKAVRIRKLGNFIHVLYFSASFPLISIIYLAVFGTSSTVNNLILFQFAITLLNSVLSLLILRNDKIRN